MHKAYQISVVIVYLFGLTDIGWFVSLKIQRGRHDM